MRTILERILPALTLFFYGTVLYGHPQVALEPTVGWLSGLLHPLSGFDHFLPMIAVGILSISVGGRSKWLFPTAFLLSMIAGGSLGIFHVHFPGTEIGIAFTTVLLGLAIFMKQERFSLMTVFKLVLAGLFHGHAHGTEIPRLAMPALYMSGFVVSTTLLLVCGITLARFASYRKNGERVLQASGAGLSFVGLSLIASIASG
jgi:urease accessory protein